MEPTVVAQLMEPQIIDWYTSVAGIAAAAAVVGAAVRQWLGDVRGVNRVPLVVYVGGSSVLLAAVAKYVMGVELADTFGQLIVKSATASIFAVGSVSFVSNIAKPLIQTVSKK